MIERFKEILERPMVGVSGYLMGLSGFTLSSLNAIGDLFRTATAIVGFIGAVIGVWWTVWRFRRDRHDYRRFKEWKKR